MSKNDLITVRSVVAFFSACALGYYFLLFENFMHTSISAIIERSEQLDPTPHICILGLLPIYIATIVFGAAMFGIYLGNLAQHLYSKFQKQPHTPFNNPN